MIADQSPMQRVLTSRSICEFRSMADSVEVIIYTTAFRIIQGMSSINENSASFTADVLFSQIWIDPGMAFDNMTR